MVRNFKQSLCRSHILFSLHSLFFLPVRGWRDVNLHFCENLQRPFVTGRATLSGPLEVAFPVAMEESLSHQYIQALFSVLRVDHEQFDRFVIMCSSADNNDNNNNNNGIERRCSKFLQSPHCAANCLRHVRLGGPGAVVHKSHATH